MNRQTILSIVWLLAFWMAGCSAQSKNGFDLQESLVPVDHILSGGPAKDGIPAIDDPHFVAADQAGFLHPDSPVLGLTYKGLTKAYPINILNWHEIVNDSFNGEPVVITFCPLCGSGMAFSATIDGKAHTFGVSGLLYNVSVHPCHLFNPRSKCHPYGFLRRQGDGVIGRVGQPYRGMATQ